MRPVWPKLGLAAVKIADSYFAGGIGGILLETTVPIYRHLRTQRFSGIDANAKHLEIYSGELDHILSVDEDGQRIFVPQVLLLEAAGDDDQRKLRLDLIDEDFRPPFVSDEVVQAYKNMPGKKVLFDGENARLVEVHADHLVFQGCSYFDYVGTNLALDHPQGPLGTLRSQVHGNGLLGPLSESPLANSTGINGLLFTSDGYLVIQRRRTNLIVNPGQMCPGFSGTVDKADIVLARHSGGTLAELDVVREMVEELGIARSRVKSCRFLGITRELARGGAPEMFFAVDLSVSKAEVSALYRRDEEGDPIFIPFGALGTAFQRGGAKLPIAFSKLLEMMSEATEGQTSIPLLTNLMLWHRACWPASVTARRSNEAILQGASRP